MFQGLTHLDRGVAGTEKGSSVIVTSELSTDTQMYILCYVMCWFERFWTKYFVAKHPTLSLYLFIDLFFGTKVKP